jgi:hypothetical protein
MRETMEKAVSSAKIIFKFKHIAPILLVLLAIFEGLAVTFHCEHKRLVAA